MRWRIVLGLLCSLFFPLNASAQAYRVGVDPRVELLSIVFRLAGNNEYTQGAVPSYLHAIDRYFGPYRNHKAVLMARALHKTDGVGFDAPMNLAVHLKDVESLAERVPLDRPDNDLDPRWHGAKVRAFIAALRSFVVDTHFEDFLKPQQALYDVTDRRLREYVRTNLDLAWYTRFFGAHSPVRFIIIPGLVNGGPSYGASLTMKDGVKELYAIPGVWQVDADGLPIFTGNFLDTTVHEFIHSYSNPLVDKYYPQMEKAGNQFFQIVSESMHRQAYGDGKALLYESMVRAATIRYIYEHQGSEAARRAEETERANSFLWIGGLCELLAKYEKSREKYPTLDSFMPNIVRFFNEEAPRIAQMQRLYEESRPKVVSVNVPNHSRNVDPNLSMIVIRFDRPVRQTPNPQRTWDPRLSNLHFDKTRTVLTVPVTLEPDRDYAFALTWPDGEPFVSTDGVPMNDYLIQFHTKSSSSRPAPR